MAKIGYQFNEPEIGLRKASRRLYPKGGTLRIEEGGAKSSSFLQRKQLTMNFEFKDFGFYLIDEPYLKYLHNIDEEVRGDEYKDYERKPFVGILAQVDGYTKQMKGWLL